MIQIWRLSHPAHYKVYCRVYMYNYISEHIEYAPYNQRAENDNNQYACRNNNGALELHLCTQSWIAPVKSAQSPNIISPSALEPYLNINN